VSGAAARCGRCGAELAGAGEAIEVGGGKDRFANRAGVRFEVGCYAHAPGCVASGPAGDEDTWFEGMTWQRAYCTACSAHTGWLFRSKSQVFFALIR
jgi:hypothetical protein